MSQAARPRRPAPRLRRTLRELNALLVIAACRANADILTLVHSDDRAKISKMLRAFREKKGVSTA